MSIKIKLQDLQTKKVFKGSVDKGFEVGRTTQIRLTDCKPPSVFDIKAVKGWVMSDSARIIYVIDGQGKRFKIQVV
jgi:hypothetical protein